MPQPGDKFLVGINLGWFENKYGADLGGSEFSDAQLWSSPQDVPLTIDLTKPNVPGPSYLSQHPEAIEQYFSKIAGLNIVRLWLFEQLEGITFSKDGTNKIISYDVSFLDNLTKILDSASNHGIKIYLALFNSWDTYESPSNSLNPARLDNYHQLFLTRKQLLVKIMQDPSDFCNNVLIPILDKISTKHAIYAIDLINEPEGMTENNVIFAQQLQNFTEYVTQRIKPYGIKVSIGCMGENMCKTLSSTLIDFSDYHIYNNKSNSDPAVVDSYNPPDFNNKYCIIGEYGYHPETNPYDATKVVQMFTQILRDSNKQGYAGALAWRPDDYLGNSDDILQAVIDYASTQPTIQSITKKGCFIATAAFETELHPHVQFLRDYRDSVLLRSSHKKQFEDILDVYYRFSPPIADSMKKDKMLKRVMKYMIVYPIVLSLKILVKLLGNQLKDNHK